MPGFKSIKPHHKNKETFGQPFHYMNKVEFENIKKKSEQPEAGVKYTLYTADQTSKSFKVYSPIEVIVEKVSEYYAEWFTVYGMRGRSYLKSDTKQVLFVRKER